MSSPRCLSILVAPVVLAALIAGCGGGSDSPGTGSTAAQQTPAGSGHVQLEKVGD